MFAKDRRLLNKVMMTRSLPIRTKSTITRELPIQDLSLDELDPELTQMLYKSQEAHVRGISLQASQNYTYKTVMQSMGSCLVNKYSHGFPGARPYGGNQFIDQIENLCIKRALECFKLDPDEWHVNVQAMSGGPANLVAYTALVPPGGCIMGLSPTEGGHASHGFQTDDKKNLAMSQLWKTVNYQLDPETQLVDYDDLAYRAQKFKPKLIVAGYSCYPRDIDYKRLSEICDDVGAFLLVDIAQFAGLLAGGQVNDPFKYADVVTSSTHKSLNGPRAGMIISRIEEGLHKRIDNALFPMLQGGPHNNNIAALAAQLKTASTPEWKEYTRKVCANAQALASEYIRLGNTLTTGGTDLHMMVLSAKARGLTGPQMVNICRSASIHLNEINMLGDSCWTRPGGVRLGTLAVTTRGYDEDDVIEVARFHERAIQLGIGIKKEIGTESLEVLDSALAESPEILKLRVEVEQFATQFPIPGFTLGQL